jgi:hypothetical protein
MGPYAGVDFNLNLCPLQSRLQRIYPMPESTLTLAMPESTLPPQSRSLDLALTHSPVYLSQFVLHGMKPTKTEIYSTVLRYLAKRYS